MTDRPATLTRADLADHLVATGALKAAVARNAVGDLIDAMTHALRQGQTIHLRGLGRFEVVATPERPGRNPRTGEPAVIPAGRKIKFRPSKSLAKEINA